MLVIRQVDRARQERVVGLVLDGRPRARAGALAIIGIDGRVGLLLGSPSPGPAPPGSPARRRSSSARSRPKAASASRLRRTSPWRLQQAVDQPLQDGASARRSAPPPRPAPGPAAGPRPRPPPVAVPPPGRRGRDAATKPRCTARASNSSSRSAESPVTAAALTRRCGAFGTGEVCMAARTGSNSPIRLRSAPPHRSSPDPPSPCPTRPPASGADEESRAAPPRTAEDEVKKYSILRNSSTRSGPRMTGVQMGAGCGSAEANLAILEPEATPEDASASSDRGAQALPPPLRSASRPLSACPTASAPSGIGDISGVSRRRQGAGEQSGAAGEVARRAGHGSHGSYGSAPCAPGEIAEHEGRRPRRGRPSMRSRAHGCRHLREHQWSAAAGPLETVSR